MSKFPKYEETPEAISSRTKRNILSHLRRLREWLSSRFPAIAGIVAFTAGVCSLVFTIIKLTKGAAVSAAKTTSGVGKTIAKILAKLGLIAANVGSMILTLFSLLAQEIMWVSNNLWVILVAIGMFLWKKFKGKERTK